MDIYERACAKVPLNDVLDVYEIYVSRAMEFFGIGKVRSIYESAIEKELPHAATMVCTRLRGWSANLENLIELKSVFACQSTRQSPAG